MKNCYTLLFSICLLSTVSAQVITTTTLKPPAQLVCSDVPAILNNVVFGAIPPNSANNPVVVFVHGWFDNGYAWFMAKNKWYEDAYNSGYKTAFFFQSYSDAFEDNGRAIAAMIRETCKHYNTDKVIALCHSKGGYDIEYALYNENMWDTVQGVIALSTPYWGAPMSDMIATPIIRSFLESVPIVGPIFQGKGSYQMQTAYMAGVVRPMMDNHPDNRPQKFHCFASWGKGHRTAFPADIPDDPIKVIFKDYHPFCIDLPGFGNFASDLITGGLNIIGDLSHLVQVQSKYDNPQKNQQYMDGLAPYYSSIRPGSVVISQPPPSQQSYLNHLDVLLATNMWSIVQPEIEYFKTNPVFRKSNPVKEVSAETTSYQSVSDIQLIQSSSIAINTAATNKLFLLGNFSGQSIKVVDEQGTIVKSIPLNFSTQAMFDVFHEVDLSTLLPGKKYTLQSPVTLLGFLEDGNKASVQLNTNSDKTYYADEPLNMEVALNDWTDNLSTTTIRAYLNRNINSNGEVIWDKIIPVSFVYDDTKHAFVCRDKLELEDGVYNLSVFTEGAILKRFTTTSILIKQERNHTGTHQDQLTIYPNPATDIISVKFIGQDNAKYVLEIFDVVGKKVANKTLKNNGSSNIQIDISAQEMRLSKGSYLVSLIENGERKASKVLIVN